MADMPPKLPRSRKTVDPAPSTSLLNFNEALSWTPGNAIPESEIIRRLQALHAELVPKLQNDDLVEPLRPIALDLINERLLKHRNKSIKSWTTCCIVEIIRHSAPNAPYTGRQLKHLFTTIINHIIPTLADSTSTYHSEHLTIIKSLKDVESILLITDVPSSTSLTRALFSACFDALSVNPSEVSISVCHNLTALLATLVNEAQNLPDDVIDIVLAQFLRADPRSRSKGKKQPDPIDARQATLLLKEVPPAYTMAQDICLACVNRMARYVLRYFSSILADTALALSDRAPKKSGPADEDEAGPHAPSEQELAEWEKAHLLLRELWRAAHGVLQEIIPQMEIELVTDNTHIRLMAVDALGGMIAGIGSAGPPIPPTLDPAAYPSQSLLAEPEQRPYHFLLTPSSAISFISRHPATYEAFLARRRDKSPMIRAAWATAVGRIILFDVGGRGFNSDKQRTELLGHFADSLSDLDDKVRLSAIKVLEEYPFSDVLSKLGEHGAMTQPGSILSRLGDRVKDIKVSVATAVVPLLARWWGVAAGAIAAGDSRVKNLIGCIPDLLCAAYFVQERDIHQAVDKAAYDSLLPLTFPPRIRQPESNNSQASNPAETDPEANRLRAERLLLLVDSLSPKSRGAFFAKQRLQPQFATYVGYYLNLCEKYNGGVTTGRPSGKDKSPRKNVKSPGKNAKSPEKDVKTQPGKDAKSQLVLLIETALIKQFPDPQRAKDDLIKFAKQHDRRCYALIRFTSAPESDWSRVRKSIKEICKRVEDSQSSVLSTIVQMLSRCSLLAYNRSNLPSFFHFARSNEKGLSAAAHAVLKEISQVQGQVFSTLIKQQCGTLIADKPSIDKPHGRGAVEDLKACSRLSVNFPQKIPNDWKFFTALMAFVNHGTPRAAKYAACILLTASPKKDMYAEDIYSSCAADFNVDSSGYLSKLSALSQLMRYSADYLEPAQVDTVVDIAINRVLLRKHDAVAASEISDEDWTDEPDEHVQGKFWALKILVNRLQTYPEKEDVSAAAEPVFSFLNTIIAEKGQMAESPVSPAHASRLRLAAATSVLKLCQHKRYNERLQPTMFHQLCLTAQDSVFQVREPFIKKIMKHISKNKLAKRFHTPLYLLAFEPHADTKRIVENWLRGRGQALANDSHGSLEMILVRLISLLAHHPDFITETEEETRKTLQEMTQYIIFFMQTIVTPENVSLIFYLSQRIKNVSDGIDKSSTNIYTLSDLAQAIIRKLQEKNGWNIQTLSGKFNLPLGIFAPMESHASSVEVASKIFLPSEIVADLDELIEEGFNRIKPKKARRLRGAAPGTKRARRASDAKEAKPPAKKARSSKAAKSKGKGKAKASDDDVAMAEAPASPSRRRSGRSRVAKNYKETDEEEEVEKPAKRSKRVPQLGSRRARAGRSSLAEGSDSEMDIDADL